MRRLIPVVLIFLLLTGCGERELVIEYSAEWVGHIITNDGASDRLVVGSGNQTYRGEILGSGKVCWSFHMGGAPRGEMLVYMRVPTITGTDERGSAKTFTSGENLSGCSDD